MWPMSSVAGFCRDTEMARCYYIRWHHRRKARGIVAEDVLRISNRVKSLSGIDTVPVEYGGLVLIRVESLRASSAM